MKEVVITMASVLSPLGNSVDEFRTRLFRGDSGVTNELGKSLPRDFPVPYLAKIKDFSVPEFVQKKWFEASVYSQITGHLLQQISAEISKDLKIDALISGHRDPSEFHVALAALKKGNFSESQLPQLVRESPFDVMDEFLLQNQMEAVPEDQKIWIANACSAGNACLGMALNQIRNGQWKRALVVNLECDPNLLQMARFFLLGALATKPMAPELVSRPFALDRGGFVKGDGAALFMLEERTLAEKRKAPILARVMGYGASSDAYGIVGARPDSESLSRAMRMAMQDAKISIDEIDCVSAHATSTPLGDQHELAALENVFRKRKNKIPVTALKSQLGHATMASGGLAVLATLLSFEKQMIAPILNLKREDTDIVSFVGEKARPARLDRVMCNNIGFGGQNSALILERISGGLTPS